MGTILNIYHGSADIIETPEFGKGKPYNDYGLGFYCTENIELAKEWACNSQIFGFANKYELDTTDLKILDLTNAAILTWLAVLVENRTFKLKSALAVEAHKYLHNEFLIDLSSYDIIRGYRADDSYFSFANAFLNGTLSLNHLSQAMKLGKLGEQVVLKSEKSFDKLHFLGYEESNQEYYHKRENRDKTASDEFKMMSKSFKASNSVYILDILRGEWKKDDPRLR